ncbi:TIM21 [Candida pseudojiufengensis]|uniref:TIM21 n=1 Tax=Candida pseudojiufengensis TaxID=497109 RepID=UPI0022241F49|nr:TIM21 [Candida pseudojiufengensis]KAI5959558.1 TIM21 [Candida pseudojiufengensis]
MFKQIGYSSMRLNRFGKQSMTPIKLINRSYMIKSSIIKPLISTTPNFKSSILNIYRNYSLKDTPIPPQPPKDKNLKGKKILNRINRAFTFSLSTILVIFASAISLLVIYLILSELLLPSGDTRTFNKAVKIIENSKDAQTILNFPQGERLKAYGIVAADKWIRNRPVQSIKKRSTIDDKDHLFMQFQVETNQGKIGIVNLEQLDYTLFKTKFEYISLDVPGEKRIWVIEPEGLLRRQLMGNSSTRTGSGFLGLNWGPKKD